MTSMNGSEYSGNLSSSATQARPGAVAADGTDRSIRDTPASNRRNAAIAGIVLALIPVLSVIGLIVSIVAFRGYRRAGESATLAVVGVGISAVVLAASVTVLLLQLA